MHARLASSAVEPALPCFNDRGVFDRGALVVRFTVLAFPSPFSSYPSICAWPASVYSATPKRASDPSEDYMAAISSAQPSMMRLYVSTRFEAAIHGV